MTVRAEAVVKMCGLFCKGCMWLEHYHIFPSETVIYNSFTGTHERTLICLPMNGNLSWYVLITVCYFISYKDYIFNWVSI